MASFPGCTYDFHQWRTQGDPMRTAQSGTTLKRVCQRLFAKIIFVHLPQDIVEHDHRLP